MSVAEGLIYFVWIIFGLYYLLKDKRSDRTSLKHWPHVRNLIFGALLFLSGITMFIASSISDEARESFIYLIGCFLGLYFAITFRHTGKTTVEWRKKQSEFFGIKYKITDSEILINQIGFLFGGILFFIIGLVKFLLSLGLK